MCSGEDLALGHNHDALLKFVPKRDWDLGIINSGLDASHASDKDLTDKVKKALGPVAPGLLQAITLTGARNATEQAVMHALSARGDQNSSVLGFSGSCHGDGMKMSAKALSWPTVSYPQSSADEARALDEVQSAVNASAVKAVVVEPIHSASGA